MFTYYHVLTNVLLYMIQVPLWSHASTRSTYHKRFHCTYLIGGLIIVDHDRFISTFPSNHCSVALQFIVVQHSINILILFTNLVPDIPSNWAMRSDCSSLRSVRNLDDVVEGNASGQLHVAQSWRTHGHGAQVYESRERCMQSPTHVK